jgi:hypothetical protein
MTVAAQGDAVRGAFVGERDGRLGLDLGEVGRGDPGERLGDDTSGGVTDPVEVGETLVAIMSPK